MFRCRHRTLASSVACLKCAQLTFNLLKLRISHDLRFTLLVSVSISPSFRFILFGKLLRYADKRIVNILRVYIERNNLQVELI